MGININQLAINVNLHALQPDFLNAELHHVIAAGENIFRFAKWHEKPGENEEKFYCFLTGEELLIPAGNIVLKQSYTLSENPVFPLAAGYTDFIAVIEELQPGKPAKSVRHFYDEDIDVIKQGLEDKYGTVEKHIVTSRQGQHLLFLISDIEISVSAAMVYFRYKTSFSQSHYRHVEEEKD